MRPAFRHSARILPGGLALLLLACSGPLYVFDGTPEPALPPAEAPVWDDLVALRSDDWFRLLDSGEDALEWRLRAIDSATSAIDLQSFLWDRDPVGDTILARLIAAADRGVRVRILLDDSFLFGQDARIHTIDAHPQIEYRVFNPFGRRGDSAAVRQLLNLGAFSRLDHRMHNKVMIADNRVAIVGGRNLADQYFGYDTGMNFRDMEVLGGGRHVRELSRGFDRYWNNHWSVPVAEIQSRKDGGSNLRALRGDIRAHDRHHAGESAEDMRQAWREACRSGTSGRPRLLLDRPPSGNPADRGEAPVQTAQDLTRLLDGAEREVILVSAYFIPTPELEQAIERAEERGVSVRILTNSLRSNNHTTAHSAYRHHLKRLVSHGADLHELRAEGRDRGRHMTGPAGRRTLGLHAKTMVIDDDQVFIGSANLDPRSLRINTEMGLVIESADLNRQLRDTLGIDLSRRNAWHVRLDGRNRLVWAGDDRTLTSQPAASSMQRIEDWLFTLLPIEGEM